MNRQNIAQGDNDAALTKYWVDNLSDENKRLEQKITKDTTSKIAQPGTIIAIADWNEAIRNFAGSFLFKKTETSYYRIMATYLGKAVGIDIRMSNHPAGDDDNWLLTEGNGLANCRLSIYFRGDTSATTRDCSDGVPLYEQGFHYEHLKNAKVLAAIKNGIIGFMKSGVYKGVSQPIIESDDIVAEKLRKKEIERNEKKKTRYYAGTDANIESEQPKQIKESKTNKNMKKNVVKINENTLRQIVAESVKRVLKEYTDPSTDGAIYPQNREEDIKRDAYRLKGKFIGDKTHRQSASDDIKTSNKYRRYDAWSEEDGIKHGAPFYIPLLNAMNAAKKALNHEFAETIDRNPNIKPKEQKFLEDKWQQAMDGLEKSFYEIRNYYREQGRGTLSDYRGR